MKVTVCQLDNRDGYLAAALDDLAAHIEAQQSEFLLLPEMCFHEWLAADADPDHGRWLAAVEAHAAQILELNKLGAKAIISTRPIINGLGSFRNQAYLWSAEPRVLPIHEKYYLPDEDGYWEKTWYDRGELRFDVCETLDIRIGVQICTEMWFFEWARHFAKENTELLCIPRATPHATLPKWLSGGQAAAVCSGAFCLSSNLWNPVGSAADCGGLGWIISPEGGVLAQTSEDNPYATVEVDLDFARRSKSVYPRYVAE